MSRLLDDLDRLCDPLGLAFHLADRGELRTYIDAMRGQEQPRPLSVDDVRAEIARIFQRRGLRYGQEEE